MAQRKKLIATPIELQWPYKHHYGIFQGIQDYGRHHADWVLDPGSFPEMALARGVRLDGIVGRITPECLKAAREASIPVVNVWSGSPVNSQVPGVQIDHDAAGRMAAEHLIARGFKRLAFMGYTGDSNAARQCKGIREKALQHGCRVSHHLTSRRWDTDRRQWVRFEEFVLRVQEGWERSTGVVCASDALARAVASICVRCGWVIPDQLALVGTGDDTLICTAADPVLSSVAMGHAKCGFEAARLLDRLMSGEKPPRDIIYSPPEELMVRHSSDFFSVNDAKVAQALRHMADSSSTGLSVPSIAHAVGIGRKTLERRFQRHLGHTINEELNRLRIEKLKRLLVESETNIAELGEKAGFGNFVSMHKMFKRSTGMTPGEYRERHGPRPEDRKANRTPGCLPIPKNEEE